MTKFTGLFLLIAGFSFCAHGILLGSDGLEKTLRPVEINIKYAGQDAVLSVYRVTDRTIEITITPDGDNSAQTSSTADGSEILIDYPRKEIWTGGEISEIVERNVGAYTLEISAEPLQIVVKNGDGLTVQQLTWPESTDGRMEFKTDAPVFGLGHGGPQFDRRGEEFPMRDGWGAYERPTHGSRVAAPMIMGADGWSMFLHHPVNSGNVFDLSSGMGVLIPDSETLNSPMQLLLTLWDEPEQIFSEYGMFAGKTPMPPIWSLGYMQSHRTLESREQMLQVARNFRERKLPADAVIYLGTGFTPSGWNRGHGNFEFNEEIFPDPENIFSELNDLDFRVVLHTYNPPVGLHGESIDETSDDPTHIRNYWLNNHEDIFEMGVDGWWPDGGEPLSSESRVARYRMYWDGPLYTLPNTRPWNINRTGYSGVHRYGGWIWSGDPDSYWETLETQIAVGLNHVVSLTPFWGSDTGGFLPSRELTGELYIRWFQFSTFTPSFRGHGRAWHLRLPWGWNTGELGPPEVDAFSDAFENGYPFPEELRNALIEPIAREYLHLRYKLLSYSYNLMRQTHDTGLSPMRAMWLHYPEDDKAVSLGDQYMWGREILVAPVYEEGATVRTLYLPAGNWYDYWTNESVVGGRDITRAVDLATMPLYVRAGAILPIDPVRQFTTQHVDEPITFQIYPGEDGTYNWYRDDGESQEYINGDYTRTLLTWNDENGELTIEPNPNDSGNGDQATEIRFELIEKSATGGINRHIDWDGTKRTISFN